MKVGNCRLAALALYDDKGLKYLEEQLGIERCINYVAFEVKIESQALKIALCLRCDAAEGAA